MSKHKSGITKEMTVLDILSQYQGAEAVFRRYDHLAGECICCNSLFETVEGICLQYNLNLEHLLSELACCQPLTELKKLSP